VAMVRNHDARELPVAFFMTTIFCGLFVMLAAFEWLQTWIACFIDMALGGRTISPPPFGYFATRIAGGLAWLAVFSSALLFAIRLVNAPIFLWLESMPLLKIVVIISLIAAFMIASDRKIGTARICAHEIYGSGSKATTYQLGGCIALFAGLWLLTVHARP